MFVYHMGDKPSPQHTLDRVDNDYIYCPENCRWATPKEQSNNTRQVEDARGYTITPSGRYQARISVNDKIIPLGTYDTPEEASAVYQQALQNKLNNLPVKDT